jgi:hypothetical protein
MDALFHFPTAQPRDPAVEAWLNAVEARDPALGRLARDAFEGLRRCGAEVGELLHDGHPTACVAGAAFAAVNAFSAHVNLAFFRGAELPDPAGLLQGAGRRMRHVKLKPGETVDAAALQALVQAAYADMRRRLA